MKSFFKKLSLVLAAAMVITMLPAQSIKAAGNDVVIGPSKELAQASQKFTMEVGSTAKWGFWGASDYAYKTDASSIRFTSSKPAIATVDSTSRVVTAVSAGETTIKFAVTTKSKTWTGEATLTVTGKGTPAKAEAKQYAVDKIYVTFATADEAAAAKNNTKVQLIKNTSKTEFVIPVNSAKVEVKDNIVIISKLSWGVTYRVLINDVKLADVPMTRGTETLLIVTYEPTAVGSTSTAKNITGGTLASPSTNPKITIYDENGIVIIDDDSKNVSGLRFSSDSAKTKNAGLSNTNQGSVTFRSPDAYCYVKATYTFKVDNVNKEITWEGYATAKKYEAPSLGGFVEGIAAVEPAASKRNKNVKYESFSVELNAKEERELAYYFLGSDGLKYTGQNVTFTSAISGESDVKKNIYTLDGNQYSFYFKKEDPNATSVSISVASDGKSTTIKGWTAGTERIYLYRQLGKSVSDSDEIMGYIDVTVNPEAVVTYLQLDNSSVAGFVNGYDQTATIKATITNQYNKKTDATVTVYDKDGNQVSDKGWGIAVDTSDHANGVNKINFTFGSMTTLFDTNNTSREFVVKIDGTSISASFGVVCEWINTPTTENTGWIVTASDKTIVDKTFASAADMNKMAVPIEVIKTVDGNRFAAQDFYISTSQSDFTGLEGKKVVVITNNDGVAVKQDNKNTFGTGASAYHVTTTSNMPNLGTHPGYEFDVVKDLSIIGTSTTNYWADKNVITGMYNVYLYDVDADGEAENLGSATFTITDARQKLQSLNNTYALYNNNKAVGVDTSSQVWNNSSIPTHGLSVSAANADAQRSNVMSAIVKRLYAWYDKDSDNEVDNGEIGKIENLFTSFTVVDGIANSDMIYSTDAKEVYVKYVTIEWTTTAGIKERQKLEINRKFTLKK